MEGAIIGAFVALLGTLISSGKEAEAQHLRQQIADQYGPDILPEIDRQIAQETGKSAFETSQMPAQGRAAQVDVDQELANIYDTAGNTAADQSAYDLARRNVSRVASTNSANAGLSAARRGQAGGGLGAILASQSGQDELDALAGLDAQMAADSRSRGLAALNARAGNASSLRGGDWRELEGRASAIDLNNRFNASQRTGAAQWNAGIPQQNFNNEITRLSGRSAAVNGVAQGMDRSADAVRQTAGGVGNAAASYGQSWDWGQGSDSQHDEDTDNQH
jgi:hypothetical protein